MRFSRRFAPQNDRVGGWDSHVATLLRMTEWVMRFSRRFAPQNDQLKKAVILSGAFPREDLILSSFIVFHINLPIPD